MPDTKGLDLQHISQSTPITNQRQILRQFAIGVDYTQRFNQLPSADNGDKMSLAAGTLQPSEKFLWKAAVTKKHF